MFKGKSVALFFITGALLVLAHPTSAQFQQLPTPLQTSKESKGLNIRTQEGALQMPFWDDFSRAGVNSGKWINEGTTQSFTIGNAAPSLGVLLMDGVDERGRPYSNVLVEQGITDRISSKPINLSELSEEERNTVFLSFYWQAGGKAELPDFNDDLNLFFLDSAGIWIRVWQVSGELDAEQFFFTPEIIQVMEEFQHENFQFRFQISGRASGPFDAWLLDYIYLNKNRNLNDIFFKDRTLTQTNSRPLGKFSAVPLFELRNESSSFWTNTSNEFKNLENRFRAMEYSIELRNKADNSLVNRINNNTPFNPVPLANERRLFTSNDFGNISFPEEETDLELVTYISSGDRFLFQIVEGDSLIFNNIDLRVNDTVKTTIPIRDFYAYDDGNVDYSAGINQRDGMLANRFETENVAFIKGISINFTNFAQANTFVDLMIWGGLNSEPLFVKEVFIPEKESLEEFAFFELEENVRIDGPFFIGFKQFTNDFIYVGLDKTFDNGSEIFFNVAGSWQQNDIVEGSLMIRVHLSEDPLGEEQEEKESTIRIYPNPVTDWLNIEGEIDDYNILDNFGRRLELPEENLYKTGKMINFAGLQKGIYLIQIIQGEEQKSFRILVK
jgi:hypothetical protein